MGSKFSQTKRIQPTPKICKSKDKERDQPPWPPQSFQAIVRLDIGHSGTPEIRGTKSVKLVQVAWDEFKWIGYIEFENNLIIVNFTGVDPRNFFNMEVIVEQESFQVWAGGLEAKTYMGPKRYDTYLQPLETYLGIGQAHLRVMA